MREARPLARSGRAAHVGGACLGLCALWGTLWGLQLLQPMSVQLWGPVEAWGDVAYLARHRPWASGVAAVAHGCTERLWIPLLLSAVIVPIGLRTRRPWLWALGCGVPALLVWAAALRVLQAPLS